MRLARPSPALTKAYGQNVVKLPADAKSDGHRAQVRLVEGVMTQIGALKVLPPHDAFGLPADCELQATGCHRRDPRSDMQKGGREQRTQAG